jgi:hypothetical protein
MVPTSRPALTYVSGVDSRLHSHRSPGSVCHTGVDRIQHICAEPCPGHRRHLASLYCVDGKSSRWWHLGGTWGRYRRSPCQLGVGVASLWSGEPARFVEVYQVPGSMNLQAGSQASEQIHCMAVPMLPRICTLVCGGWRLAWFVEPTGRVGASEQISRLSICCREHFWPWT